MRKVLIGCGVVVLLVLCFMSYVGYQLWPSMSAWHEAWSEAFVELAELDTLHPFDPDGQTALDVERFELMLDMRVGLATYFATVEDSLHDIKEHGEQDDGPGWLDQSASFFETMSPNMHQFAGRLREARMGPTEFSWHTRVLWAALARVDAGVAGPELEPLRGEYGRFREAYELQMRQQQEKLTLAELIATVPPELLVQAGQVLAQDPERARQGLAITDFDYVYLQQPESIDTLMEVAVQPLSEQDQARPEGTDQ